MRDTGKVHLKVTPDLDKIVAAAKEAQVSIQDIHFVRNTETNSLEALSILIEGENDATCYFSWLLKKSNVKSEPVHSETG